MGFLKNLRSKAIEYSTEAEKENQLRRSKEIHDAIIRVLENDYKKRVAKRAIKVLAETWLDEIGSKLEDPVTTLEIEEIDLVVGDTEASVESRKKLKDLLSM